MEAHAAGHQQHPLLAQRSQRPPGGQMQRGIERSRQRKRDHRNQRRGEGHLEGHKDAVIEAAAGTERRRQSCLAQQPGHARGKFWLARRGPGQPVSFFREAGIVEDRLGSSRGAGREGRLLPMAADHQDSLGRSGQRGRQPLQEALRGVPGIRRSPGPIHEEAGSAPVGQKDRRLALRMGGHGHLLRASRPETSGQGCSCLNNYLADVPGSVHDSHFPRLRALPSTNASPTAGGCRSPTSGKATNWPVSTSQRQPHRRWFSTTNFGQGDQLASPNPPTPAPPQVVLDHQLWARRPTGQSQPANASPTAGGYSSGGARKYA